MKILQNLWEDDRKRVFHELKKNSSGVNLLTPAAIQKSS